MPLSLIYPLYRNRLLSSNYNHPPLCLHVDQPAFLRLPSQQLLVDYKFIISCALPLPSSASAASSKMSSSSSNVSPPAAAPPAAAPPAVGPVATLLDMPTDCWASAHDVLDYLQRLQTHAVENLTLAPFIYPYTLTYPDRAAQTANKDNWGDGEFRTIFGNFWTDHYSAVADPYDLRARSPVWLGFASTWMLGHVAKNATDLEAYNKSSWHAWGIALLKRQSLGGAGIGKDLLIWDCDIDPTKDYAELRPRNMTLALMGKMRLEANKHGADVRLWYGGGGELREEGHCLRLTLAWLTDMAMQEAVMPLGDDDLILRGFTQITKK